MSELAPSQEVEAIVGARRLNNQHLARAESALERVTILHSGACLRSGVDLRECPFSLALDRGIDLSDWRDFQDQPVQVLVRYDRLVPVSLPRSATLVEQPDMPGRGGSPAGPGSWVAQAIAQQETHLKAQERNQP